MPFVRSRGLLIYFSHVPKCAGTTVENYLVDRFGAMAFQDKKYLSQPELKRWSRTSPQHIDRHVLDRLFPPGFFDISFAVVRNPVDRIISAWHFQLEVERTIPQGQVFREWLMDLEELHLERPFAFDNHTRPMSDLVPLDAKVFHLENGLDPIIPWLDDVTGHKDGPRQFGETNRRGAHTATKAKKIQPDTLEMELINRIYAADFKRFGYSLGKPGAPDPQASNVNRVHRRDRSIRTWFSGILGGRERERTRSQGQSKR